MNNIFIDDDYMLMRLFSQVRNAIFKLRRKELLRYGLTPRKAAILLLLFAEKENVNPYKIAKWMLLEHHSVSELIDRMEKDGLIEKKRNSDDRKTIGIQLTDKGVKAAEQAGKVESFRKVMAILSEEERTQFINVLKRLRDNTLQELGVNSKLPYPPF